MRNRSQLALGLILILLGAWFIAQRQVPALNQLVQVYMSWPLSVVAAGVLIFLIGLLVGAPGMAIPAAIVAGIGGILYYQQMITHDPTSWSYMWTLILGFIGVGEIVAGLLNRNNYRARAGLNLIGASVVMFIIFAAIFGRISILGPYAPAVLLILVGVWVLGRGLWRRN
jgi:peptidoglycan/LPS O-acetylase OafA/YrhL